MLFFTVKEMEREMGRREKEERRERKKRKILGKEGKVKESEENKEKRLGVVQAFYLPSSILPYMYFTSQLQFFHLALCFIFECQHPKSTNLPIIFPSEWICKKYFAYKYYVARGLHWYKSFREKNEGWGLDLKMVVWIIRLQ